MTPSTHPPPENLNLAEGMRLVGLNYFDLWTRYLGLGGSGTLQQMNERVNDAHCTDDHEYNMIAQALNDAAIEQGGDHPVAYRRLYHRPGRTGDL